MSNGLYKQYCLTVLINDLGFIQFKFFTEISCVHIYIYIYNLIEQKINI